MSTAVNAVEMPHSADEIRERVAQRALWVRAAQVFPLTSNYRRR